jgi:hypothetical protein
MLGENLLLLKGISNRTVYLNTVLNSFIGYKTKKDDGEFQALSIYLNLGNRVLYQR